MVATNQLDSPNTIIGVPFEYGHNVRTLCDELPETSGTQELAMKKREFKIRLADDAGQRSSASMLINKMYSWRGYSTSSPLSEDPNRITLVAGDGEHTIGTISINFDSEIGLLVDQLYKDELDKLRASGRRVCEFIKLAVDGEVKSKRVLASLFHIAMIFAHNIRKATDIVIEVNPRHVKFYERMLDFTQISDERLNPRVNAPAVLLGMDLNHLHSLARHFGGKPELANTEKSFYPYFFSPAEEEGITNRLIMMDNQG
ncbi:N-acetyltransferase [Chitinivorax sp. B]|uniref:N-acyl amino acid synthase FeeM domain-containing protein n=1 Tax=Chitinivorax sp. B TaxID=2502235 RepID=UPI002016FDE1|nr:N-acetyltransferase [Chitinivorax sp. B]